MRAIRREKNDKRVLVKLKEKLKNQGKITLTEDMCKFADLDKRKKETQENANNAASSAKAGTVLYVFFCSPVWILWQVHSQVFLTQFNFVTS